MNHQVRTWRLAWRVLAIALMLAAIPLPGLAEETSRPAAPRPMLKASIAKAAASAKLAPQVQTTGGDKSQLASKSFFKTPAGLIVLAVVGAGAGFAVYSASKDRIHSVVRQNQ